MAAAQVQPSLDGLAKRMERIHIEQQQQQQQQSAASAHQGKGKDKLAVQVDNQNYDPNAFLPVDSDIGRYDGGFERAEDESERSIELLKGDAAKVLDLDSGRVG